ncbi:MAG TPA: DUF58 domain-containing protein [Tepidisphaeraceae bacterium]
MNFSLTGVVYTCMMLFMGIAAINSQANLLFGIFGLMIGVLLISGVISRMVLRGLTVERGLPDHACVGDALTVAYEFHNRNRFWPSLSVVLAELDGVEAFSKQPHCFLLHAAGGTTASVPMVLIPKRRGLHALDHYQLMTSFPFGFVRRAVTRSAQSTLLIYPPLAEVSPKLLAMCRSADTSGEMSRPQPGGADEFYGVKEYRAGDNPRWIYWRRSARGGGLVSKEMTSSAPPRVMVLVDTFAGTGTLEEHADVERSIAMAASLAAAALDQGLSVGLCGWSGQWAHVMPMRGKRHKTELLSHLAQLPHNTTHSAEEMLKYARPLLSGGVTGVLFSPRPSAEDLAASGRGSMVVVPANSARAQAFFKFDPKIDFISAMPADHLRAPKS